MAPSDGSVMLSSADPALLFPHEGYQGAARDIEGGNYWGMSFDDIAEVLSGLPLKLLAAFAQAIEAGRDGGLLENIGHPALAWLQLVLSDRYRAGELREEAAAQLCCIGDGHGMDDDEIESLLAQGLPASRLLAVARGETTATLAEGWL